MAYGDGDGDVKRNPEALKDTGAREPHALEPHLLGEEGWGMMRRRPRPALILHVPACCVILTLYFSSRHLGYIGASLPTTRLLDDLDGSRTKSSEAVATRIVSWNLRVPFPVDASINRTWPERRHTIANAIAMLQPDILLLQEDYYLMNYELLHQIPIPSLNGSTTFLSNTYQRYGLFNRNGESYPSKTWPENAFTGDGTRDGEHNSIWWSSQKWKLIDASTFWLSPTSNVAGTSFGEVTGRIVNCVVLVGTHKVSQTTRSAYHKFCSTHMPSHNTTRQMLSAEVISSHFKADKGKYSSSFIGGDFNTNPGASVYNAMLNNGFGDVAASSMSGYNEVVSTADWYKDAKTNKIIDYLWVYNADHAAGTRRSQPTISTFVSVPCCDLNLAVLKYFIEKQMHGERLSLDHEKRPASDHLALVVDIFL